MVTVGWSASRVACRMGRIRILGVARDHVAANGVAGCVCAVELKLAHRKLLQGIFSQERSELAGRDIQRVGRQSYSTVPAEKKSYIRCNARHSRTRRTGRSRRTAFLLLTLLLLILSEGTQRAHQKRGSEKAGESHGEPSLIARLYPRVETAF